MTTENAAPVADEAPPTQHDFTITRKTVERLEELKKRVDELKTNMDAKKEAAKWATKSYDEARNVLERALADMLAELHGDESLPLFQGRSMSEAVEVAKSDPIVSGLVERMLKHNITHVNTLIVAGYDEAQRNELTLYLDALDLRVNAEAARAAAEAEGKTEDLPVVPDAPETPAFLAIQANLPAIIETLRQYSVETTEAKLVEMYSPSDLHLLDQWSTQVAAITAEKGDALVASDLPEPPVALVQFGQAEETTGDDAPAPEGEPPAATDDASGEMPLDPEPEDAAEGQPGGEE